MIWNADSLFDKIKLILMWVRAGELGKFVSHGRWIAYDFDGKTYPALLFLAALGTTEEAEQQLAALKATGRLTTKDDA